MYNMKKTFYITCTMEERWIDTFMSFLHEMQMYGIWGNSGIIAFYSDGDGDFKPEFKSDIGWDKVYGTNPSPTGVDTLFDAR